MNSKIESPPISQKQAHAILTSLSDSTNTGIRNRALVALIWRVGMRPGEALAITAHDLDLDAHIVHIDGRPAGIDPLAEAEMRAWASRRAQLGLSDDGPFISTLKGKALSQPYVRELLPRVASSAGVATRVYALALRYACAAEMATEGIPTEIIVAQLGIKSQSSVARYLPQPPVEDIVAAMRRRAVV